VARPCAAALTFPDDQLDFDVLFELRERGGTDYLALPIAGAHAVDYMVTFVTDRVGGFTANEIDDLSRVAQRLAVVVDRYSQEWVTRNVLTAYLGVRTGPKVLAGQIRRGHGVELTAVLWSSDLRGFTERSDRLPPDRMIEIVNALDVKYQTGLGNGGSFEFQNQPCVTGSSGCGDAPPTNAPEPTSMTLLGSGLALLGWFVRRRGAFGGVATA
jgi:PEP-CTERM motif